MMFRTLVPVLATSLLLAGNGSAQSFKGQTQVWLGGQFGSFACWQDFGCDNFVHGEARHASGTFAGIGRRLNRWVLVGLEADRRSKDLGYMRTDMASVSGMFSLYPFARRGLYLSANLGIADIRESAHRIDDMLFKERRMRFRHGTIGAGYDVQVVPGLMLKPSFSVGGSRWIEEGMELWHDYALRSWQARVALGAVR